jgi:hypothetical protein
LQEVEVSNKGPQRSMRISSFIVAVERKITTVTIILTETQTSPPEEGEEVEARKMNINEGMNSELICSLRSNILPF